MFIITDEPTTLYLKTQIFWRAETQVDILYFLQVNSTFAGKLKSCTRSFLNVSEVLKIFRMLKKTRETSKKFENIYIQNIQLVIHKNYFKNLVIYQIIC